MKRISKVKLERQKKKKIKYHLAAQAIAAQIGVISSEVYPKVPHLNWYDEI